MTEYKALIATKDDFNRELQVELKKSWVPHGSISITADPAKFVGMVCVAQMLKREID